MWKAVIVFVLFSLLIISCSEEPNGDLNNFRKDDIQTRAEAYERARNAFALPETNNFPLREALVEFTIRQDMVNHPWYTYILGDNGNMIGYYVTKTGPINSCNFLSSTEDAGNPADGADATVILTAPSLDGIFYGGGGSQGSCDKWFFFDYTTNAMIEIRGLNFFTTDAQLAVDAQPIRIRQ